MGRKPRGFDRNDVREAETARVISTCLDHDRVSVVFETLDRYPNRDGFVELLDEELRPVGDLVIQVKKLPSDPGTPPRKPIKTSTLAYGYMTNCPFVLLGVDTEADVVYWRHASGPWLDDQNLGEADTRTVEFPVENRIAGEGFDELDELFALADEESQYLRLKQRAERQRDLAELIYEVIGDRPFKGASLPAKVAHSGVAPPEHVDVTPSVAHYLAERTTFLEKLPVEAADAVAIVDSRAEPGERCVASIRDTQGVQELAFRVVNRDAERKVTEPINWRDPGSVVATVNQAVGATVLQVARDAHWFRLTADAIREFEA